MIWTRSKRWVLPTAGFVTLFILWELGAIVTRRTADHPNIVWPSLEYVFGKSLPGIGTFGAEDRPIGQGVGVGQGVSGVGGGQAEGVARETGGSTVDAVSLLAEQSIVTLRRVLIGSALGAVIGIGLGLLIALNRVARQVMYPAVNVVRQVPLLALTFLFLIWFGGAERGVYAFIVFGVATMLVISTINAVRTVPVRCIHFAQTMGARRRDVLRTVIFPATVPELMSGVKVAVGLAWPMALAAEYLGTQEGLGRLMLFFELFQFTGRMMIVLLLFVLWALLTQLALIVVENRLTRWVPRST